MTSSLEWYQSWTSGNPIGSYAPGEINATWYSQQSLAAVWQLDFQLSNRTAPGLNWTTQVSWTIKNDDALLTQNNSASQLPGYFLYPGTVNNTNAVYPTAPTWVSTTLPGGRVYGYWAATQQTLQTDYLGQ